MKPWGLSELAGSVAATSPGKKAGLEESRSGHRKGPGGGHEMRGTIDDECVRV